jgi:flagellar hook assembly protein FlgD
MGHVVRAGLAVLVAAAVGCGGSEKSTAGLAAAAARDSAATADSARAQETSKTLKVTNVMIGKHIGQGSRVTEPTFQFDPVDTVYVSIGTVGSPDTASFEAHWTNQKGEVVDSSTKTIQPKGRENTELHASKAKGWTPGAYRITIYANGDSVDSKTFAVRKPQQ